VAAALQDGHRARVLGMRTRGTGEVSGFFPMPGPSLLKIAVAVLSRPGGAPIAGVGIVPDISLDDGVSPASLSIEDLPCPGKAIENPLSHDPAVARAVAELGRPL